MNPADSPTGLFDNIGKPVRRMPDLVRVATNGVIFDDQGRVLLQRRADNGFWGLPGGMLDPGESLEQGAIREVLDRKKREKRRKGERERFLSRSLEA